MSKRIPHLMQRYETLGKGILQLFTQVDQIETKS